MVMNDDRRLSEWLRRADQDFAQAIAADTDTERALGLVKLIAAARSETLALTVRGSLAPPAAGTTEPVEQPADHSNPADTPPQDAWDLVRAAQNGDRSAFALLYSQYVDMVFRYLLFRVGDRQLAEELTSEAFLRVLRRITTVRYQGRDIGAWLVTIARNLVVDHVKSHHTQQTLSPLVSSVLLRSITQLGDDDQRECIALRFLHGMSVADTAEVMNRDEEAVKTLQQRAVRALAQMLPPSA